MRRGRVLLAGDAVHLMPPFPGHGFCSGARDTLNLAWKLGEVLAGAPASLLDSYERERCAHVAAMQRVANFVGGTGQTTRPRGLKIRARCSTGSDDPGSSASWATTSSRCRPTTRMPSPPPARIAARRTVGSLFPQGDRLDDRLAPPWAAVAVDDRAQAPLEAHGFGQRPGQGRRLATPARAGDEVALAGPAGKCAVEGDIGPLGKSVWSARRCSLSRRRTAADAQSRPRAPGRGSRRCRSCLPCRAAVRRATAMSDRTHPS
jgi:hypothetical protein